MRQLEETRRLARGCHFQSGALSRSWVQEFAYSQQKLPVSSFNNRSKARRSSSSQNTTLPPGIFLLLSIFFGQSSSQTMMKGPADITGSSPGLCVPKTGAQPGQKAPASRKMLPGVQEQSSSPAAAWQPCPSPNPLGPPCSPQSRRPPSNAAQGQDQVPCTWE